MIKRDLTWILIPISVLLAVCAMKFEDLDTWYAKLLCFGNLFKYCQFFVFGLFFRRYYDKIKVGLKNEWTKMITLSTFVIGFWLCYNPAFPNSGIFFMMMKHVVIRYLGLLTVLMFFMSNETYFASDSKVCNVMRYVGRHTLDIYLIHFFLLPDLSFTTDFFAGHNVALPEFLFAYAISLVIVSLCLITSNVIRCSRILSFLLFGQKFYK